MKFSLLVKKALDDLSVKGNSDLSVFTVVKHLGFSRDKLYQNLLREDTDFKKIKEEWRMVKLAAYLNAREFTHPDVVAALLGYNDNKAFELFCKRNYGSTFRMTRKRLHAA